MPLRVFVDGVLSRRVQRHLAEINRPLYAQSLFLFIACRYLPPPDSAFAEQCTEYREILDAVERAVKGESRRPLFVTANDALRAYVNNYEVSFINDIYHELPTQELLDILTERKEIQALSTALNTWKGKKELHTLPILAILEIAVAEKVKEMIKSKRIETFVELWEEEPIIFYSDGIGKPSKFKHNSIVFPAIKIQEGATLTVLLHRLMEHSSVLPEADAIHLSQFPQFYRQLPLRYFSGKIPCLCPWAPIEEDVGTNYFHLIIDRNDIVRVRAWNGIQTEYINVPDECSNAWQIERNLLVVRNRTRSFSLSTWHPLTPYPVPPSADAILPPSVYSSNPSFGDSAETLISPTCPNPSPIDSTDHERSSHYSNIERSDSDSTIVPSGSNSGDHNMYTFETQAASNGSVNDKDNERSLGSSRLSDRHDCESLCDAVSVNTIDTDITFFTAQEPATPSSTTSQWSYRDLSCGKKGYPEKTNSKKEEIPEDADALQEAIHKLVDVIEQIKFPSLLDNSPPMQPPMPPLEEEEAQAYTGDRSSDSRFFNGAGDHYYYPNYDHMHSSPTFLPLPGACYNNNVGNVQNIKVSNVGNNNVTHHYHYHINDGNHDIYIESPVDDLPGSPSNDSSTTETPEGRRQTV